MKPEQKAKELIEKLSPQIYSEERGFYLDREVGKEFAIICVDEIDEAIDFDWMEVQNLDRVHAWWDKVKTEIEKL